MILLNCFLFAALTASAGDARVTLTVQAAPANLAVEKLAQASGLKLVGSPSLSRDIIALRLVDVPLSEARKRISECLNATWVHEGVGFRLVRKDADAKLEQAMDVAEATRNIQAGLAPIRTRVANRKPWTAESAEMLASQLALATKNSGDPEVENPRANQLWKEAPLQRLFEEVAVAIPIGEYLSIEDEVPRVWSSQPTRSQSTLPPTMRSLLARANADQGLWHRAARKKGINRDEPQGDQVDKPRIAKILIKGVRESYMERIRLALTAYDEKGRTHSGAIVYLDSLSQEEVDTRMARMRAVPPKAEGPIIEPDQEATALIIYRLGSATAPRLEPTLLSKVMDPSKHEPLSLVASKSLVQAAELRNLNLVACISDFEPLGGHLLRVAKVPVDLYLDRLRYLGSQVDVKDGWLVVRPMKPVQDRVRRVDRAVLADYLKMRRENPKPSIEQRSYFAWRMPLPLDNLLVTFWEMYGLGSNGSIPFGPDQDVLRLLGSLSATQIAASKTGVAFRSLSPEQLGVVRRLVYGFEPWYRPKAGTSDALADLFSTRHNLASEPTEFMPDGLPPDATLRITETISTVTVAPELRLRNMMRDEAQMDPKAYAREKLRQSDKSGLSQDELDMRIDLDSIRLARQRKITLTFDLTREIELPFSLTDLSYLADKPMSYRELPEAYRKDVEAELARLKRGGAVQRGEGG